MNARFVFLFLSLTLTALAADEPAPITLEYKLAPDSAFSYHTTLKLDGKVKLPDADKPESLVAVMDMRQRVHRMPSDKPDNLVLENNLYNLKVTNNGVTSQAAGAPTITTIIDAHGKLLEVRGLSLLTADILPGLDPTTFSSLLYNLPVFPEKPVKPGDTWNDEIPVQLPNGQIAKAQRKLTFLSSGKDKSGDASARIRTEMNLPIEVKVAGANGGTVSGSQTGTGESSIRLADGMPLESKTDVKMEIVAQPAQGQSPQSKGDGSVHVTTTIHVEAKRVPDTPPPAPKTPPTTDNSSAPDAPQDQAPSNTPAEPPP